MSAIAKDRVEEVMVRHGLTDVPITDLNKEKAVNDLMVAEVLITRTLALDTFFRGLNCLGLGCCGNIPSSKILSSPLRTRLKLILKH